MNIQEKIDQYLQGVHTAKEKEHLEKELLSMGSEVTEEFEDMKLIKEVIRQNVIDEKLAFLKSLEPDHDLDTNQHNSKINYIYFLIIFALAAALCYYLYNQSKSSYQYEDYYESYAYTDTFRSIDDNVHIDNKQGFQAYTQGNYQLCVSLLEGQNSEDAAFYKGLAFMEMKDFPNAIKAFESVQNSNYPVLYFLSLSYIENENIVKAKQTLKQIPEDQTLYYEKAKDLMKKL